MDGAGVERRQPDRRLHGDREPRAARLCDVRIDQLHDHRD